MLPELEPPFVAVLQVHPGLRGRQLRLEPAVGVGEVVEARFELVLPDRRRALRPRAEPEHAEIAAEILTAQEPHLGVEVPLDNEALGLEPVPVPRPRDVAAVARVVAVLALGPGARDVGVDREVAVEGERRVRAQRLVRPVRVHGLGAVREDHADAALLQDVAIERAPPRSSWTAPQRRRRRAAGCPARPPCRRRARPVRRPPASSGTAAVSSSPYSNKPIFLL